MLVRTNLASRRPAGAHLATPAGEQMILCNEFYPRGTEVFGEGEEADYVYQITSGAVRTYKLLLDGRRQINAFHLRGEIFGVENGATHRFTAEAVVQTELRITRRRSLLDIVANREPGAANLVALITRNLQHAENHMLLLGRKTALERVAAFLLEMDERLAHPSVLILPMNRRDIADYLGLTLETVSRALSTLRREKMLLFDGPTQRQVVLLNRERLTELNTR